MKVPIFIGTLRSTEIARKNWEHFAARTAISGIRLVCGENVCGSNLKWGHGAKCIGGEIKVNSIERAVELKKRGYIVTPYLLPPVVGL